MKNNDLRIEYVSIEKLKPYENNAKIHTEEQIEQIKNSIKEFGMNDPIGIWGKENLIVEGHGRLIACKELGFEKVPIIRLDDLTDEERKAYTLAHNKLTMNTDFDIEKLNIELSEISFDMVDFGFDSIEIEETGEVEIIEDEVPEVKEETKVKIGDIYQLGNHRLMCGDSTKESNIIDLLGGNLIDVVFTDPPYGMKKEKDGVLNDNLNFDDLLDFNKKWIPLSFKFLKDMGSWYCWGIDEPLFDIYSNILKPMIKENKIVFRNYITWAKHSAFGMKSDLMLQYPRETEKCLFVVKGQNWNNNNSDFFNTKYEKILDYLLKEAEKVNLTPKKLHEIVGVKMYGHWFSKSQFTIIPENHYELLREEYKKEGVFQKSYDELKGLICEDNNLNVKPFVDVTWFDDGDIPLTDVWRNSITGQKERELTGNHATPKPLAICERAIRTSSRENENILDLFGGSGSTLITCEETNRNCYMMELDPQYVDVIIKRWENYTGKKAVLLKNG